MYLSRLFTKKNVAYKRTRSLYKKAPFRALKMFSQANEKNPRPRRKTWVRFQSEKSKTGSSSKIKKLREDHNTTKPKASQKLVRRIRNHPRA
jgi:hypothetical protein